VFGGQYPGHEFIPRLYVVHVLLIPGLLAALIAAHLFAVWHQEHTEWPGHRTREKKVVGEPLFPVFVAKTQALFFFVFSVLALLAAVAQINPIWLYGPYTTASASSNSTPDWYIGFLEGSLRLMPATVTSAGGHTFAWNVFIPAVLLPVLFFTLMYGYPFFEQWATGDRRHHHILDRPRNVPARTALGAAIIAMALDLLLSAADDVISFYFQIPLFILVWVLRVGFFAFPVVAFALARHVCLALQQRDRERLAAGMDTGIISALPDGSYAPQRRPVPEEEQAGMRAERATRLIYPTPRHLVPLPTPRRIGAQVRSRLNHFYTRYQQETLSGGDGQGRAESPPAADGDRPAERGRG
jgi:ubiquinol-cytochrome c reductase cytochrome b subunit